MSGTVTQGIEMSGNGAEDIEMSGNVTQDIEYTIGDIASLNRFITELRLILADHTHRGDILEGLSSTLDEHPLLARNHRQPERWLRIKLQVAGEEGMSATLFVQDKNLYCLGFMNQNRDCYELTNPEGWKLPSEYNAVPLVWGITYDSILKVEDKEVKGTLNSMRLGKTFAEDAVRVLARFATAEPHGDNATARKALAGLIFMVCESAKINPVHRAIADGWNNGARLTKRLMVYIGHWELISNALLDWKDERYGRWTMHQKLAEITGVEDPIDALDVIHLVRNFTMEERQLLGDFIYDSE